MNGNQIEYVGVNLPRSLMDDVDNIIKGKKGGYRSRAEFLKDAARQLLFKIYSNDSNKNYRSDNNNEEKKKMEISKGGEERTQTQGGTKNEPLDKSGRSPEETKSDTIRLSDKQNQPQPATTKRTPDQQRETQKERIRSIGGEDPYEGRIKENW